MRLLHFEGRPAFHSIHIHSSLLSAVIVSMQGWTRAPASACNGSVRCLVDRSQCEGSSCGRSGV